MGNKDIDYAIVGGGIAGTYCAWRLQKSHGKKKRIVLFEYTNRIGGRLLTIRFPGSNLKAELGGMRYMPVRNWSRPNDGHPLFTWLVEKEFNLQWEDFPMGYHKKGDNNNNDKEWGENNYAYFRDKHSKIKDFRDKEKSTGFEVDWSERGKSPNDLQEYVQEILVPGGDKLDLHQWNEVKVYLHEWNEGKVSGEYLWKYGFWNLLYRVLSPEAYVLLKYGSGYDTNASNGNAVALLPIVKDYLATTQYRTLKDGMMSLPSKLAEKFKSLDGIMSKKDRIQLHHRLESIGDRNNDGLYDLSFSITSTDSKRSEVTIDTGEPPDNWKARNIILAIPSVAIQKIKWEPFQSNKNVMKMIDSVIPQEAIKLVLEYPYAWWKALKLFRGRSITDLPIRQTYYFSNLEDLKMKNPFKIKPNEPSLLMASYSDIESVPFWRGLEGTDDSEPYDGPENGYRASKIMVQEAQKQVARVHGQYELPKPTAAAYHDWADPPYGAAWHCWRPGERFDRTIDLIRRPLKGERVFICGEAYSAQQGWAEGALNTAEQLLTTDLDATDRLQPLIRLLGRAKAFHAGVPSFLRVDSRGRTY